MSEIYDAYYDESEGTRVDPLTIKRCQDQLAMLARHSAGRRLLDIGCGRGELLAAAPDWDRHGIDLSPSAVRICAAAGLDVTKGDILTTDFSRPFDVITMIELLEHVESPCEVMTRAASLLAPGGVLYLTTPNFASLSRRLLGAEWRAISIEHLTYFTPSTLTELAQRGGLAPVWVRTENLSLYAIQRRLRPNRPSVTTDDDGGSAAWDVDQQARRTIERSTVLRAVKPLVNTVVAKLGVGDAIKALFHSA